MLFECSYVSTLWFHGLVCDCGISWSYSLTYWLILLQLLQHFNVILKFAAQIINCWYVRHPRIQQESSTEGGPDLSVIQKLTTFVLVLNLFYRRPMVDFKENYIVPRFLERGPTFVRGPTFSRGSNCLFPKDTYIACDLPGGIRTTCSLLYVGACTQVR